MAASTSRVAVEDSGTGPGPARARSVPGAAGLLLLVAVAAGLLGQGGYHRPVQRLVALLVAAAALIALLAWPPGRDDARRLPLVPAAALAAWGLVDAARLGLPPANAAGLALLLLGLVAVLLVCRRLAREDRELLLAGITGTGLVVALAGWLGVAGRVGSLAWEGDGVWRASATLTYPNAAAAVLVAVVLVVLARLVREPRSAGLAVTATVLLAGLAATMSRAGVAGLAVGLVMLGGLLGVRRTARAAVGPCAGALLALAGLLPSMPAAVQPRPVAAVAGLAAGLALAAVAARMRAARFMVAAVLLVAVAGGLVALGVPGRGSGSLGAVADARVTLASPDRGDALRAALRVVAAQPLGGSGPGHAELRWEGGAGGSHRYRYVHNEYLQVAAELGLVGLGLLAVLLVALARLLWRARPAGAAAHTWAGVTAAAAAFAVHSAFDFLWHLPAVVLTVAVLLGIVLPPPRPFPDRSSPQEGVP